MEPPISPLLFALLLLLSMLVLLEVGHRFGVRQRSKESGKRVGLGTVEAAIFALFGLMIAFAFSGAASRFNEKRMLIAEEVNSIGTAYLRLRLLPHQAQPALQESFRRYVESRLETYRKLPNMVAAEMEMAKSKNIQEEVWAEAVAATQRPDSHPSSSLLLLPALNNMIDITTIRTMALQIHPPRIIYVLLFGLGLICSLLAGYRMASGQHRSWLHILCFTVLTVIIVYVMLDMEYPRSGLIRLESGDQMLVNLRESMK